MSKKDKGNESLGFAGAANRMGKDLKAKSIAAALERVTKVLLTDFNLHFDFNIIFHWMHP